MNESVFGIRMKRLSVWVMTLFVSVSLAGCGGGDQSTGSAVKPDEEAAKRQDEMKKFYEKSPLPKPKQR
jgi:hypothetical protein